MRKFKHDFTFCFLESITFAVSKILSNYEFSVKLLLDRDEAVLFLTLRTTNISFCSLFVLLCLFFTQGKMTRKSHTRRVLTPLCTEIKVGMILPVSPNILNTKKTKNKQISFLIVISNNSCLPCFYTSMIKNHDENKEIYN